MPPMFSKSILDVQYIYRTSNIYIQRPISISAIWVPISDIRVPISDVRYLYPTSDIQYPTSARARARAGLGQGYRTLDIDIGRPI